MDGLFGLFPLELEEVFHLLLGELHMGHWLDAVVASDGQQALIGNGGMVDLDVGELGDGGRLEQTGSVTGCPGDSRAVSGYALIVQETTTGLFGKFYIESDTHTFTDGKHEMALTLAFSNMMDEKEIENQSQG